MAQSPDHPELKFVQARYYDRGRTNGDPLWIVVHDMEAGEHSDRAENTAEYFRTMSDGRVVSAHYCADNNSVIQCVRLGDVAYTVGNTAGNYRGINWEFAGFARQTRAQWLDAFGLAMFRQAAPIIRADAARYGIPLTRCSIDDLKARRKGITSHNDLRLAYGGTSHTDPGPNFPWDVFMQIIQEDDMELTDKVKHTTWVRERWPDLAEESTLGQLLASVYGHTRASNAQSRDALVLAEAAAAGVAELKARPLVDPAALQVAVEAALQSPAVAGVLAQAYADEQSRRLAD